MEGTKHNRNEERMITRWLITLTTMAAVMAGTVAIVAHLRNPDLQPTLALDITDATATEKRALALDALTRDHRWEDPMQRESLCSALNESKRAIIKADGEGALTAMQRATTTEARVIPGMVDEASSTLGRYGQGEVRHLGNLVEDPRWAMPNQRGALCNALVHLQHTIKKGQGAMI
jgi:hypothetical protein